MKVLYESVIDAEQRNRLGEYYTPDWLAEPIVEQTSTSRSSSGRSTRLRFGHLPLPRRPATWRCRRRQASRPRTRYSRHRPLRASTSTPSPSPSPASRTCSRSAGTGSITPIDRLLGSHLPRRQPAVGPEEDPPQHRRLSAHATAEHQQYTDDLPFPRQLLNDAGRFDQLVGELADRSTELPRPPPSLTPPPARGSLPEELHARSRPPSRPSRAAQPRPEPHLGLLRPQSCATASLNRPENRDDHSSATRRGWRTGS